MIRPPIKINIGIKAKAKNSCSANLFITLMEHISKGYVNLDYLFSSQIGAVQALSWITLGIEVSESASQYSGFFKQRSYDQRQDLLATTLT